ncbi:MAG: hypothetical protein ACUVXA_14735, partial [Candidatus Jordarchaeum sp.]|uniref:hypothetical protein n=1 Tax=Candidatus Jordarchaeum sp. TaxID=2823881 RepID=UPI004049D93A
MKGKLKILAASVLIMLTISLGTGYLTLGPLAFANNNHTSLGLIQVLNRCPKLTHLGHFQMVFGS